MMATPPLARLERIIVCSDGSEFSAGAERVAVAAAAALGTQLVGMTMVRTNPEYEALAPELVRRAEEEARRTVGAVGKAAAAAEVPFAPLVARGDDPYREIVESARVAAADLIVMGRRGRRGLARLMVGDATAKVAGNAACPVLVVPKAAAMWRRRVVLCTDGSDCSDAALAAAARLAVAGGLPVTVVGALVPSHSPARQQDGAEAVRRAVAALGRHGLAAEGVERPGEADQVIVDACVAAGGDLIVMGTHGRTGLGKAVLGSVSERVIGKAACPVLVVKA